MSAEGGKQSCTYGLIADLAYAADVRNRCATSIDVHAEPAALKRDETPMLPHKRCGIHLPVIAFVYDDQALVPLKA